MLYLTFNTGGGLSLGPKSEFEMASYTPSLHKATNCSVEWSQPLLM